MSLYAHSLTAAVAFLVGALVTEALRDGGEILAFVIKWRSS